MNTENLTPDEMIEMLSKMPRKETESVVMRISAEPPNLNKEIKANFRMTKGRYTQLNALGFCNAHTFSQFMDYILTEFISNYTPFNGWTELSEKFYISYPDEQKKEILEYEALLPKKLRIFTNAIIKRLQEDE